MRRRVQFTPSATGGVAAKASSAMRQSSEIMMATMAIRRIRSPAALSAPEANISLMASTSLVTRVTSRPTGVRSKKPSLRVWRKRKTCARRSNIARAPASCIRYICGNESDCSASSSAAMVIPARVRAARGSAA